jgi:hypothetical protein
VPLPAIHARVIDEASVDDLNGDGRPHVYRESGRANPERLNHPGTPDTVLMNRGLGRFEAIEAPLPRDAVTLGTTLVDLDGDDRLDIVESVEVSWLVGHSRTLLNRTPPGRLHPVFKEPEHIWGSGTAGMGVAVGDVNSAGQLDSCSASVGWSARQLQRVGRLRSPDDGSTRWGLP